MNLSHCIRVCNMLERDCIASTCCQSGSAAEHPIAQSLLRQPTFLQPTILQSCRLSALKTTAQQAAGLPQPFADVDGTISGAALTKLHPGESWLAHSDVDEDAWLQSMCSAPLSSGAGPTTTFSLHAEESAAAVLCQMQRTHLSPDNSKQLVDRKWVNAVAHQPSLEVHAALPPRHASLFDAGIDPVAEDDTAGEETHLQQKQQQQQQLLDHTVEHLDAVHADSALCKKPGSQALHRYTTGSMDMAGIRKKRSAPSKATSGHNSASATPGSAQPDCTPLTRRHSISASPYTATLPREPTSEKSTSSESVHATSLDGKGKSKRRQAQYSEGKTLYAGSDPASFPADKAASLLLGTSDGRPRRSAATYAAVKLHTMFGANGSEAGVCSLRKILKGDGGGSKGGRAADPGGHRHSRSNQASDFGIKAAGAAAHNDTGTNGDTPAMKANAANNSSYTNVALDSGKQRGTGGGAGYKADFDVKATGRGTRELDALAGRLARGSEDFDGGCKPLVIAEELLARSKDERGAASAAGRHALLEGVGHESASGGGGPFAVGAAAQAECAAGRAAHNNPSERQVATGLRQEHLLACGGVAGPDKAASWVIAVDTQQSATDSGQTGQQQMFGRVPKRQVSHKLTAEQDLKQAKLDGALV